MPEIWLWQTIITPHMAHLAVALARRGCRVTYVAEQEMTGDRQKLGWEAPEIPGISLVFISNDAAISALLHKASADSVHICQGIRSNGRVKIAQRELSVHGLRQWVILETVEDSGWKGFLRRMLYRHLIMGRRDSIQGILAIGSHTADWVVARGMPARCVFPFAYFLTDPKVTGEDFVRSSGVFRFVFVGQLIPRKRVELLLDALTGITEQDFELIIVGDGPEKHSLRAIAASQLADRVRWLGCMPLNQVQTVMIQADCLVLPSAHDGWGAVVSEALMVGTPVICSDACGAADVVRASGVGGVFCCDQVEALRTMLDKQIRIGPIDIAGRKRLATWATVLGADAGASYLLNILDYSITGGSMPVPPWLLGK
jgi:glycosyltransferase involved in cell wall biosynthesis